MNRKKKAPKMPRSYKLVFIMETIKRCFHIPYNPIICEVTTAQKKCIFTFQIDEIIVTEKHTTFFSLKLKRKYNLEMPKNDQPIVLCFRSFLTTDQNKLIIIIITKTVLIPVAKVNFARFVVPEKQRLFLFLSLSLSLSIFQTNCNQASIFRPNTTK